MRVIFRFGLLTVLMAVFFAACDQANKDTLDLAMDPPSRKPIDRAKFGVNNFFVDPQFGNIPAQFAEIKNTLKISHLRILLAWTEDVHPNSGDLPFFGFYDEILSNIPPGVDVLPVLAHTPNWMNNSQNWVDGNPRKTFVERWVRPVIERYRNNGAIVGWEIWNEPDLTVVASDAVLGLEQAENYAELIGLASAVSRQLSPNKKVVLGATSSIQQNFPQILDYNKKLRNLGVANLVDVWGVHFYGKQYEKVVQGKGVADFLNSLDKPIWVTESGEQGPNNQRDYVERTWPFLSEEIPRIDRFYYFIFASTAPVEQNYGLRLADSAFPISDLYLSLRD